MGEPRLHHWHGTGPAGGQGSKGREGAEWG